MRQGAAAAAVAAMLAAALLAGGSRASAQEAGGCFDPRPLPGYTLAAFGGGGLDLLERCAEGLGSRVHAAAADGGWLTLDPGADAGANAAFRARYADGAAPGTPFLLERATPLGLLVHEPEASGGYTLLHSGPVHYLIDIRGRIAHSWNLNWRGSFRLLENGRLLGGEGRASLEADPDGNATWEYRRDGSRFHHDFLRLPNGNVLLLARRTRTRDEAVAAGADPALVPPQGIEYEAVVEVRPSRPSGGEIVWEWSLWDHLVQDFDPDQANYGDPAGHPELVDLNFLLESLPAAAGEGILPRASDWIHANSIDYHPGLDRIAISARNFSELWIIDHGTTTEEAAGHTGGAGGHGGDLLYRWGNPRAHRAGTAADQRLFWPHHVHWIEPGLPGAGNLLVFNNGMEFAGRARGWSSVVELALPADGRGYRPGEPAEPVWTYEADPPAAFYSAVWGGAQRLPNGNTLIASGDEGTVFEVTPGGRTVWKYVNPQHHGGSRLYQGALVPVETAPPSSGWTNRLYRATRYAPDYPGLASLDLRPKGTIELPPPASWYDAAAEPAARGPFGVYRDGRALTFVRDGCAPEDTGPPFFVHAWAADPGDLPEDRREAGFEAFGLRFGDRGVRGVRFGGTCMARIELPDYPLAGLRAGQRQGGLPPVWEVSFPVADPSFPRRAASWYGDVTASAPAARGPFAVYRDGRALTFVREECSAADAEARFFVHAYAADPGDLPAGRREAGFETLDFWFGGRGVRFGGTCMARIGLPDYELRSVRAGQYDASGRLWEAEFPLDAGAWLARFGALAAREPEARAAFALHLEGRTLTLVREDCAAEDVADRFFVHVRPADGGGREAIDFWFRERGAVYGGRCMAAVELPPYAAARVTAGQYDGTGRLWETGFALPAGE